jgi:protein O-GlcNAc transferase
MKTPSPTPSNLQRAFGLHRQGKLSDAEKLYEVELKARPNDFDALHLLGMILHQTGRMERAVELFGKAAAIKPEVAEVHSNLASGLKDLKRLEESLASYDRAIALKPDFAVAHFNRGNALSYLKRFDEAVASYDKAIALQPDLADAWSNRGVALKDLKRFGEAVASYDKAIALKPNNGLAYAERMYSKIMTCDWRDYAADCSRLRGMVDGGTEVLPFILRTISPDLGELRRSADIAAKALPLQAGSFAGSSPASAGGRLRIGYLSSDLGNHPVGRMMASVIERHDRSRFEISGYSTGIDDRSPLRQRLTGAFDRFVDLSGVPDREAARGIHADGIDVLVDLNGFTAGARQQILAFRPAPVQVNALGYLGPMGVPFFDYVIADPVAVPSSDQPWYDERIVHLAHSYLPIDGDEPIGAPTLSREEYGLPEIGFVFCCFNSPYKITPGMFDVWMRILREVPGSVLWLCATGAPAIANLRAEARARGVDDRRLVFAPLIPTPQYLARMRAADLFLDTNPCSACTVGRDSMLAGLPILTCAGKVFSARHTSSLLHSAGLPELATTSLSDYEARAVQLATSPGLLSALRARLDMARNDRQGPFDIGGFVADLEQAYANMARIHRDGGSPRTFAVSQ